MQTLLRKIIREVLWFIKHHIIITILLLISIIPFFIISKAPIASWLPSFLISIFVTPEKESIEYETLTLFVDLGLAYITGIITYLLTAYIPQRRKERCAYIDAKSGLISIYSHMSFLIGAFFHAISLNKAEEKCKLTDMELIDKYTIKNTLIYCRIPTYRNGTKANVCQNHLNYLKCVKENIAGIKEKISMLKSHSSHAYLEYELLQILTDIENNGFFHMLSYVQDEDKPTPGFVFIRLGFAKGLFDFVKLHIKLKYYDFDKLTYTFTDMSESEIKKQIEDDVFIHNRSTFLHKRDMDYAIFISRIKKMKPDKEHLRKIVGIGLEMIIAYDNDTSKLELLKYSEEIFLFCLKTMNDINEKVMMYINILQVIARIRKLSLKTKKRLTSYVQNELIEDYVKIGAYILLENFESVQGIFDQFDNEDQLTFLQFPIAALWKKAAPNRIT